MKPLFKLLLALSLISATLSWSEEKPEEDFCDAEWDGKVEYKAEGEKDEPTPEEEPESPPAEGGEEKDKEQKPEEGDATEPGAGGEDEGEQPEEGQPGEEQPEGKGEQPGEETPAGGSKEDERGDRVDTYRKSAELVRDAANVDDIQDEEGYLKGSLNNRLQEHIRNPIIGAAGKLPHFKKVEPCFKTLKQDLKKEIDASKKEFEDCKKQTDSSYECMTKMEPGFAEHVKAIGEKVVQCMEKSK